MGGGVIRAAFQSHRTDRSGFDRSCLLGRSSSAAASVGLCIVPLASHGAPISVGSSGPLRRVGRDPRCLVPGRRDAALLTASFRFRHQYLRGPCIPNH